MPYKDKTKQREYMKAYAPKWNKDNIKGFLLSLNKKKDADIINWMSGIDNQQAYLKELIRADMKDKIITVKGNNGTITIDTRKFPVA